MKRDWELARRILLKMEELATTTSHLEPEDVAGFDAEVVSYHLRIMNEAGLLRAKCVSTSEGLHCVGLSLTWDGHELLDKIRATSVWNRVKGLAREKGLDLSLDVIKLSAKMVMDSLFKG